MNLAVQPDTVVTFVLVMTRVVTVLFAAPPFAGALVPLRVRVAIAASVALVVAPMHLGAEVPLQVAPLFAAIVYQVVVGAMFGYLVQLLLSAPAVAGSMMDFLTGFSAGGLFDPFANTSATPAGRLNQLIATVVLIALDGHLLIIRGVLRSYEAAPLDGMRLESVASVLTDGVGQLLLAAVEIALPVLVALLLSEVVLGLAARAAPRLNVMVVGFAIKSAVFLVGFTVTLPLLINAVAALLDRALRWGLTLTGA